MAYARRGPRWHRGFVKICVLFPLLFKHFIAPISLIVLERFSEDADMLADLADL